MVPRLMTLNDVEYSYSRSRKLFQLPLSRNWCYRQREYPFL